MGTVAYTHVDGVSLSPDGGDVWIDYSDWQEQHTTLKSRYVISFQGQPRVITGGSERHIAFHDIPQQVITEAEVWLTSNAEVARSQQCDMLARTLTQHLEQLRARR